MITRIYERTIAEINGASLRMTHLDPDCIKIPGTNYYLLPYATMGEIATASGIKVYDHALPQSFFNDYMKRHGEAPRGIWSYDEHKIVGSFVSLHDLLTMIGAQIIAQEAAKVAPPSA